MICPIMSCRLKETQGYGISAQKIPLYINCAGKDCAWWCEVNEGSISIGDVMVERCAIPQLAKEINCNVKNLEQ